MDFEPRFIFRGSAFGFGGQIREPALPYFEVQAPTTLPSVGGLSRAEAKGRDFSRIFSFGLARTESIGGVADPGRPGLFIANTDNVPNPRQMTIVRSQLFGLQVEGRVTMEHLSMALRSYEVPNEEQPWIVPEETMIEGIIIDGCRAEVKLLTKPFQECPTKLRLRNTFRDNSNFRKDYKHLFHHGKKPKEGELAEGKGLIFATIVQNISISHAEKCSRHQGKLRVRRNSIIVPNFGRIFFGELIISDFFRRLTAVRLELGSPTQGSAEGGGVESNGSAADF
jgi:hypothetical protein